MRARGCHQLVLAISRLSLLLELLIQQFMSMLTQKHEQFRFLSPFDRPYACSLSQIASSSVREVG